VPEGAGAGSTVVVTAPDGRQMNALVPPGLNPGQKFSVKVYPPAKMHVAKTEVTVVTPAVAIAPATNTSAAPGRNIGVSATSVGDYTPPAASDVSGISNPMAADTKWPCSHCTFENQGAGSVCEVCTAPRQ
jgi:hypothetical protein